MPHVDPLIRDVYRQRHRKTPAYKTAHRTDARNWRVKSPIRWLLILAKYRAKAAGLEFAVTEVDLLSPPSHCPILGIKLKYGTGKRGDPASASIDRKDNKKGYIPGNVAIVSLRANTLKNDGSAAEHRAIANWIDGGTTYEVPQ